jgi:hypothetical protein
MQRLGRAVVDGTLTPEAAAAQMQGRLRAG